MTGIADTAAILEAARVLKREGNLPGAADLLGKALPQDPGNADIALALADVLVALERQPAALGIVDLLLQHRPDHLLAMVAKARLLLLIGYNAEAADLARHCSQVQPERADIWALLAAAAHADGRIDEARLAAKQALHRDPGNAAALGTLGHLAAERGDAAKARDFYRKALALKPKDARLHYMLGLANLLLGDLPEGWAGYAWRHQVKPPFTAHFGCGLPDWPGIPLLPGQRLLVWGEQGLGDEILFASLLPELLKRQRDALLYCEPRLVPLFARSFPDIEVVGRHDGFDPAAHGLTHQVSSADLGGLFRARITDFPWHDGYLRADPARVAHYRAKYEAMLPPAMRETGFILGIAWRSGNPALGHYKSGGLADFAPLLERPDCLCVTLQYGDTAAERAAMARPPYHDVEVDPLVAPDEQAAQIAALDGIVSTSNSAVHLAGALGKPGWVLLPAARGTQWYWGSQGDATPWYPSLRLLRAAVGEGPAAQLDRRLREIGTPPG
ncbi:tetratricopeptide repeat protein [Ferrovibrio sp.]|uniref:tetratricopeptide repeat protein n=1 Tax=Ferrovibrio sp. TaxID=1917215 RepID=UPI0025B8DF35|nr:tetratricopeptide repeat protein [Ferrovibrio sp.]MBX3454121.1 tetratricopeptide repeat protein [Ferrovibrio sp.]